ncbi:MAG: proline dehydrogenase family protein [Candidatus Micrarchaeaceae archaeon]
MAGIWEKALAGRWIAGPSIRDAMALSKKFNAKNISTILNYLGEELTDREKISKAVSTYAALLEEIKMNKISASISLKPTQLGLSLSYKLFEANYARILSMARSRHIFVWLDMEGPGYISSTIRAYIGNMRGAGDSGICIQANMKRSAADIKRIAGRNGVIRLVKGAYSGSAGQCYESKEEVDDNFIKLLKYIFMHSDMFMVATHDTSMIELSKRLNIKYKKNVTYAMLNGVRNKLAVSLTRTDKVSVYVPFGPEWVAYSIRRLKEAGHLGIILKSLLENQGI